MKRLRITWLTGETDENGNPITRRQTITVSDEADVPNMQNAVSSLFPHSPLTPSPMLIL